MDKVIQRRRVQVLQRLSAVVFLLLSMSVVLAPRRSCAEPTSQATTAFNMYVAAVEARLMEQHRSQDTFLAGAALTPPIAQRLHSGEPIIERVVEPSPHLTADDFPGALLHHWRGTAFAPGVKAADFERELKDFDAYPQRFAPQVLQAKVLSQRDGHVVASMRVRQKHVITVVLDTTYDVVFGQLNARDGYSASRSTSIHEIDSAGTSQERVLDAKEEHGFMWRQNIYWTYEERDGGLYIQIESVSLSRSIPTGLGWAVRPFVDSIPRESMEFTLRAACKAVRN
jgi:hypothetical protein